MKLLKWVWNFLFVYDKTVPTVPLVNTIRRKDLQQFFVDNYGVQVEVNFIKADGTPRTLTGAYEYVPGHDKENNVLHIGKYVTLHMGNGKWRNVNYQTMTSFKIYGRFYRVID